MRIRWGRGCAAVVVVAGLLVGCSSGDSGGSDGSASPRPKATSDTTVSPVEVGPAVKVNAAKDGSVAVDAGPSASVSGGVPALAGTLPAGKVAVLTIESAQPLAVSVVSKDPGFVGTTTIGPDKVPATGFDTAERSTFVYGTTGTVPRLFVTMANGVTDPLKFANPKVTFTIRDRAASDDAPTAPSTTRGPSASTTTSTSTAPTPTAPTPTTAAPSATTTTPAASGGCPGASVPGPTPAADAAKLRCLIDAARQQAGLPVTATNSSADYFALLATGSSGINPSGVCSGKAPKSWSKGAVPVATAQRAFDALGGMNNKYVNSTTATLLGIGVGNRAFGFFQARC